MMLPRKRGNGYLNKIYCYFYDYTNKKYFIFNLFINYVILLNKKGKYNV
jgi:hypothetical protein